MCPIWVALYHFVDHYGFFRIQHQRHGAALLSVDNERSARKVALPAGRFCRRVSVVYSPMAMRIIYPDPHGGLLW